MGKTVSWGLTSLIHDKITKRNAVSGFHSTAGHFASLNAIGAETCKLNTLNFHEKDISTSCQFLLALYFWGRVQSFQYSPFPLLFHYLLSYSPLSEET